MGYLLPGCSADTKDKQAVLTGHSRALKGYSGYSGYSDPTVASRADHGNAKQSRRYCGACGNPEYLVSTPIPVEYLVSALWVP